MDGLARQRLMGVMERFGRKLGAAPLAARAVHAAGIRTTSLWALKIGTNL